LFAADSIPMITCTIEGKNKETILCEFYDDGLFQMNGYNMVLSSKLEHIAADINELYQNLDKGQNLDESITVSTNPIEIMWFYDIATSTNSFETIFKSLIIPQEAGRQTTTFDLVKIKIRYALEEIQIKAESLMRAYFNEVGQPDTFIAEQVILHFSNKSVVLQEQFTSELLELAKHFWDNGTEGIYQVNSDNQISLLRTRPAISQ